MILVDVGNMTMTLDGNPQPVPVINNNGSTEYRQNAGDSEIVETTLMIQGKGDIIWPNREGERFSLKSAHKKLKAMNRQNSGISLCWPATASVQAVGMIDGKTMYIFHGESNPDGKTGILDLFSRKPDQVSFRFRGKTVSWRMMSVRLPLLARENNFNAPIQRVSMYQIGLIGPDGKTAIPAESGFNILVDAARILKKHFGRPAPGDVIHIFGYAEGHDRGYPDYTPSKRLGGADALKSAISRLSETGYETSLYLNARLADLNSLRDYPFLAGAILKHPDGQLVIESYRGRDFAVMNPSSDAWCAQLLKEAENLKLLGADWVQLDQVAGRAAAVKPGEIWGKGYRKLIEDIHKLGLKVWIQGVSNYYPADAFEATWRPVTVLNDGTLRGGVPLGEPDTALIESLGFKGTLVVPEKKRTFLNDSSLPIIYDRNAKDDELPLWGESWKKAINKNYYPRIPGEFNGGIQ